MAIADFPVFLTTDTMNQQVTKLVEFVADVDSNNTSLESSISNFEDIFNSSTVTWTYAGSVTTDAVSITLNPTSLFDLNTTGVDIDATSYIDLTSNTILLEAVGETGETGNVVLDTKNNLSNVTLKSDGVTFGTFRNNTNNLTIGSGSSVSDIIILNGTTLDATFTGKITMPTASVNTTAKDTAGAINELLALINVEAPTGEVAELRVLLNALQNQVNNL